MSSQLSPYVRWLTLFVIATACGGAEKPPDEFASTLQEHPATGQACADVPDADAEIAEQRDATIPLVEGLTLTQIWVGPTAGRDDWSHECLRQVVEIGRSRVVQRGSCPDSTLRDGMQHGRTQLCRADLRAGAIYRTEFGRAIPDLIAGSTMSVLSRRTFRELRDNGSTWIRSVHAQARSFRSDGEAPDPDAAVDFREDIYGRLVRTGTGTMDVLVNDSLVALPVVKSEVELVDPEDRIPPQHETYVVLDDERFPLVLENLRTTNGSGIRYPKITYPAPSTMARALERDRKAVVYGIYFDYNSAAIRRESEAVLREIGGVMAQHPDWRLRVEGHTDSIGGAAFNRDLSQRRAEAVRAALAERHGVAVSRLDVLGVGDASPRVPNDTPERRARNRRVELIRQ